MVIEEDGCLLASRSSCKCCCEEEFVLSSAAPDEVDREIEEKKSGQRERHCGQRPETEATGKQSGAREEGGGD